MKNKNSSIGIGDLVTVSDPTPLGEKIIGLVYEKEDLESKYHVYWVDDYGAPFQTWHYGHTLKIISKFIC